eukprot:836672-Rhodomonas_salina.1
MMMGLTFRLSAGLARACVSCKSDESEGCHSAARRWFQDWGMQREGLRGSVSSKFKVFDIAVWRRSTASREGCIMPRTSSKLARELERTGSDSERAQRAGWRLLALDSETTHRPHPC